ncbi:N-6 DNA methylase [Halobacteriovorax sp. GB3]|uniref:N-6 DNA methylase n=1 Tax=Halobacteriovorax sp. GB3 TaxID=2719615 RepID=UPI0023620DBF|nr:N-6 DNA methylase [Halobacteriovorax sp. GB3]MDD0853157.1 N-6 DNA methylase [Halobacteriovorax sp. GB3]
MNFPIIIQIPLGLEELAQAELKLLTDTKVEKAKGVLEGLFTLEEISALIPKLKIPTRILLRIDQFKCRDLPKLYKKTTKIKWSDYLLGEVPAIKVTCKNSRLMHTKKIESSIIKGIEDFYKAQAPKKKDLELARTLGKFQLNVRVTEDLVSLNFDLCGNRLDQRGYKLHSSEAPLRENLASACLFSFLKDQNKEIDLYDPMCGSATFLFEALSFAKDQKRSFQYEYMKAFKAIVPKDLKEKVPFKLNNLYANELDASTYQGLIENIKAFESTYEDTTKRILSSKGDGLEKKEIDSTNLAIICNPPYGKRVKIAGNKEEYFEFLLKKWKELYEPMFIGILIPKKFRDPKVKGLLKEKELLFQNGGMDVKFILYKNGE